MFTPITTTKPEVVSRPWRSGACEMLHNTTCLLINLCTAHKLPLRESIKYSDGTSSHTQSCRFINNATPQMRAPHLSLTVTTVRQRPELKKLYGTTVKENHADLRKVFTPQFQGKTYQSPLKKAETGTEEVMVCCITSQKQYSYTLYSSPVVVRPNHCSTHPCGVKSLLISKYICVQKRLHQIFIAEGQQRSF